MIVYIEGCEDALNLDHVALIEFRDREGRIPARGYSVFGVPKKVDIDSIAQAKVYFAPHTALSKEAFAYLGPSARDLYRIVQTLTKTREGG